MSINNKDSFKDYLEPIVMKNGAMMANAGHFDVEINKVDLNKLAVSTRTVRKNIEEFKMADGRSLYLLGEGRLVNLAAGDGHPTEIMDLSFAIQALSALHIVENHNNMENKVYIMPDEVNMNVAQIKLTAMNIGIDKLTEAQKKYLNQA